MHAKSLSRVQLFATPWTVARQTPLSIEFSRQEYWSGLPCPSLGDPPDSGIEPVSHMSMLLLLFSHQVVSDSLRPCELQHARLPCPSLPP